MKNRIFFSLVLMHCLLLSSHTVYAQNFSPIIIDHTSIDISEIPQSAIEQAKATLHIAYGHTSHGSQITSGMTGLVSFMNGLGYPENLYAWNRGGSSGALDLREGDGYGSGDMDHDAGYYPNWVDETRSYLGAPDPTTGRGQNHLEINVIMWSWCGQVSSRTEETMIETYLQPMTQLEADYPGVTFVYMTGHLDGSGATGNLNLRNEQIREYCRVNNKVLYDFADIESYDPDGLINYMERLGTDNCDYDSDGNGSRDRNWATDWQNSHIQNVDWYSCSASHSQSLNGNLKAYAAWWLWARLAGWQDGVDSSLEYASGGNKADHEWASISFSSSFQDTPVVLADMQSHWGGEPAGLRLNEINANGFAVKVEEEKSVDPERAHLPEKIGYLAAASGDILNAAGEIIGEVGTVEAKTSANDDWDSLTLQHTYTQPVVRMQISSFEGRAPCHVRLRNVSGSSVEYQIEEWDYDDQFHGWETLSYVVLEAGDHSLPNNTRIVAGNVDINADGSGSFYKLMFSPAFSTYPAVLSQSQTYNDPAAIVTRQTDLKARRVKFRLVEEEAADQIHGSETVGYIAIGTEAEADLVETDSAPDGLNARGSALSVIQQTVVTSADVRKAPNLQIEESLTITPVPEPSTIMLLALGVLGLAGLGRKFGRK